MKNLFYFLPFVLSYCHHKPNHTSDDVHNLFFKYVNDSDFKEPTGSFETDQSRHHDRILKLYKWDFYAFFNSGPSFSWEFMTFKNAQKVIESSWGSGSKLFLKDKDNVLFYFAQCSNPNIQILPDAIDPDYPRGIGFGKCLASGSNLLIETGQLEKELDTDLDKNPRSYRRIFYFGNVSRTGPCEISPHVSKNTCVLHKMSIYNEIKTHHFRLSSHGPSLGGEEELELVLGSKSFNSNNIVDYKFIRMNATETKDRLRKILDEPVSEPKY